MFFELLPLLKSWHNGHVDQLVTVFIILKFYWNALYNHTKTGYKWKDPFHIRLHNWSNRSLFVRAMITFEWCLVLSPSPALCQALRTWIQGKSHWKLKKQFHFNNQLLVHNLTPYNAKPQSYNVDSPRCKQLCER